MQTAIIFRKHGIILIKMSSEVPRRYNCRQKKEDRTSNQELDELAPPAVSRLLSRSSIMFCCSALGLRLLKAIPSATKIIKVEEKNTSKLNHKPTCRHFGSLVSLGAFICTSMSQKYVFQKLHFLA